MFCGYFEILIESCDLTKKLTYELRRIKKVSRIRLDGIWSRGTDWKDLKHYSG